MKRMFIRISLAMSLMTSHADDATNNPTKTNGATNSLPAIQSYAAGGTPIAIPPPSTDLIEAGNDRGLMELVCPPNNRLIACFLPPSDLASLKAGPQDDKIIARYGLVEVPRRGEYQDCSASDFKGLSDGIKEQFGSIIGSSIKESEDIFNRRMKDLDVNDAQISLGKPLQLGCFFSKEDACGFGMVTSVAMSGTTAKMGAAVVLVRVKDRVLFVYFYAEYKNEDTIKSLRTTSEKWADAILKANKS